jgi:hypothetical protein
MCASTKRRCASACLMIARNAPSVAFGRVPSKTSSHGRPSGCFSPSKGSMRLISLLTERSRESTYRHSFTNSAPICSGVAGTGFVGRIRLGSQQKRLEPHAPLKAPGEGRRRFSSRVGSQSFTGRGVPGAPHPRTPNLFAHYHNFGRMPRPKTPSPTTPEEEGLELHSDAWEGFEKTFAKVIKAPPIHRTKAKLAGGDRPQQKRGRAADK